MITQDFLKQIEVSLSRSIYGLEKGAKIEFSKLNLQQLVNVVDQEDTAFITNDNLKNEKTLNQYSFKIENGPNPEEIYKVMKFFKEQNNKEKEKKIIVKNFISRKLNLNSNFNHISSFSKGGKSDLPIISFDRTRKEPQIIFGSTKAISSNRNGKTHLNALSTPSSPMNKKTEMKYNTNSRPNPVKININLNVLIDSSINQNGMDKIKQMPQMKKGLIKNSSEACLKNRKDSIGMSSVFKNPNYINSNIFDNSLKILSPSDHSQHYNFNFRKSRKYIQAFNSMPFQIPSIFPSFGTSNLVLQGNPKTINYKTNPKNSDINLNIRLKSNIRSNIKGLSRKIGKKYH